MNIPMMNSLVLNFVFALIDCEMHGLMFRARGGLLRRSVYKLRLIGSPFVQSSSEPLLWSGVVSEKEQ